MQWAPKKFPVVAAVVQVVLILIYAFMVEYDTDADASQTLHSRSVQHSGQDPKDNSINQYYGMFQDVDVMIFVGFGFLMTFLKKYSFSAVGVNMFLAAVAIQWAIIMQNIWDMEGGRITINIKKLINGNFASATVLITYGALLGKTSPLQMLVLALVEIAVFACNEHLGVEIYKAADVGGSMFLHTFGAYFGLAVSYVIDKNEFRGNEKEESVYHSDIFAMIGTVFLWMFWPSFNSALAVGDDRHRAVLNTYLSLMACCVTTFAVSSLLDSKGRFDMVHIQNATLAGGVAIGSTADMMVYPYGAMIVGAVAGCLSTIGYKVITPFLSEKCKVHDTCGVNNLHGIPGIMAGVVSIIIASLASEANYGYSLYELFPARSPLENSTTYSVIHSRMDSINPGENRSAESQALFQLKALATTLGISILAGAFTGYIIRQPLFEPPNDDQMYDDKDFWHIPEDDQ